MNKRHYEHTLPNIRGSLSNTYVSFTFCGTLLALEYNGMTLYDIILSPQSSVLNRIGNFFHKTAERKNNIFHRFYLERIKLFVYLRT